MVKIKISLCLQRTHFFLQIFAINYAYVNNNAGLGELKSLKYNTFKILILFKINSLLFVLIIV